MFSCGAFQEIRNVRLRLPRNTDSLHACVLFYFILFFTTPSRGCCAVSHAIFSRRCISLCGHQPPLDGLLRIEDWILLPEELKERANTFRTTRVHLFMLGQQVSMTKPYTSQLPRAFTPVVSCHFPYSTSQAACARYGCVYSNTKGAHVRTPLMRSRWGRRNIAGDSRRQDNMFNSIRFDSIR